METYDFSGWATKNNLRCSDGRTIRKNAFKDCDGEVVPLVWSHKEEGPFNVLGHALLENRDEGVYVYGTFNDTVAGQNAKAIVEHGDIKALSIFANHLTQNKGDVLNGKIREVSLVYAGANPGAYIDSVIKHEDSGEEEAIIYTGEFFELHHTDKKDKDDKDEDDDKDDKKKPDDDDKKEEDDNDNDDETVADVINSLTDKQKAVVMALIAEQVEQKETDDKEETKETDDKDKDKKIKGGDADMKHNIFDNDNRKETNVLTHADQEGIIALAKQNSVGSLQTALKIYAENNQDSLAHDGMKGITGDEMIEALFPEFRDVRPGAPERISRDQGWVSAVMTKAYKTPFSRIRTRQMDARDKTLRASGYKKTKQKKDYGNMTLYSRTTDPQTVYVKDKLNRDDIIDITDFDVASYIYQDMREKLNEEIAIAVMIGDGREPGNEEKIDENHIRPIWQDDEFFTIHEDVDFEAAKTELQGSNTGQNFSENYIYAEAIIRAALYSRENYKGTGTPDFYCTPHLVNVMLLARDLNGRRIYDTVSDLAKALNVGNIYTAEQFNDQTRTTKDTSKKKKLLGLFVNMADYTIGSTKGGEITKFQQFDIDFNQEKYLLETRISGALTRFHCAIALEEEVKDQD